MGLNWARCTHCSAAQEGGASPGGRGRGGGGAGGGGPVFGEHPGLDLLGKMDEAFRKAAHTGESSWKTGIIYRFYYSILYI